MSTDHDRDSGAGPLQPGAVAPDFSLPSTPDQTTSLSEIRGPVLLIFYPADWSPVCGDELSVFEVARDLFDEHGVQLLGVSVDGVWCHEAFKEARKLTFPLLADFNPKGAVARSYGVYREHDGITERALFLIGADRTVHWSYLSPLGVNPGADGALRAMQELG
jgi:peroxiredoxin